MSDLVERLRSVDWDYLIINNLCHEAADELERMQAVVDAARKQNDYRKGRLKAPNGFLIADELDAALRVLDGEP